jgi:hypothetical protein
MKAAALLYIGLLLGRGVIVGAMDDATLDSLVAENDFFGMAVQNWMAIVALIFFIWLLAMYIMSKTRAK